jgi:hypothetical protein
MAEKWMQDAVKRPGAFTKKANAAGESVPEYAAEVKRKKKAGKAVDTRTLRQAILAQTFAKHRP